MSLLRNYKLLALYNKRMNQQLVDCCFLLTQEQCDQNTNSFFPSVISYWNHILFGDLILLRRIVSNAVAGLSVELIKDLPVAYSPKDVYENNILDLRSLRCKVDDVIEHLVNVIKEDDLNTVIQYETTEGVKVSAKVGDVLQHMFNHQTHHRGQLTCILSQFNVDFGCTDLPVLVPEMNLS